MLPLQPSQQDITQSSRTTLPSLIFCRGVSQPPLSQSASQMKSAFITNTLSKTLFQAVFNHFYSFHIPPLLDNITSPL